MTDNIFSWGNYEEDPKNVIGVDTIPTQKNATWQHTPDGVFNGNTVESFFTNENKTAGVNISGVIGEDPKELVFGKGFID